MTEVTAENPLANRFQGCLLGLAVGDCVGTPVEFKPRGTFPPVTDMKGGGPFGLAPGVWTDETSMTLCLATSLMVRDGFNAEDQMKRYKKWREQGYMSSTGTCIDVSMTVDAALARFEKTGDPFAGSVRLNTAGNASLSRLAPVPMFYYKDVDKVIEYSSESSRTTHATAECLDACRYFGLVLHRALSGDSKEDILKSGPADLVKADTIAALGEGAYKAKAVGDIKGSAYVVESLEAALWSFHTTECFRDAVLAAANLGDDADTTAAICGQLAGAHYGVNEIPREWLAKLVMKDGITAIADRLLLKSTRVQ